MPFDMLVKLYSLSNHIDGIEKLKEEGIEIKRPLALDKNRVISYVREHFYENWANECDVAFSRIPISCFIAVKDEEIVGFSAYDVTYRGFFGPTGVSKEYRGKGLGKVLLLKSLLAMKEIGYGYAIIGWVDTAKNFYEKVVGAIPIEDSFPGIYKDMIKRVSHET